MSKILRRILPFAVAALAGCDDATGSSGQGLEILYSDEVAGVIQIFAARADGTNAVQLTHGSARSDCGRWSPDGRRILFLGDSTDQDGNPVLRTNLYVMNADGSGKRRLTGNAAPVGCGDWSPDGKRVAFDELDRVTGHFSVYVIGSDGTGQVRLTNNSWNDFSPKWTPDGRSLLYGDNREGWWRIRMMRTDGSARRTVASSCTWDQSNPALSPDGLRVAYDCSSSYGTWVRVVGLDGTGERDVSAPPGPGRFGYDNSPVWSPDGARLLISRNDGTGQMDLFTVLLSGEDAVRVTRSAGWEAPSDWRKAR